MALHSHKSDVVDNESLEDWKHIDSGGFGAVYKARHKNWGFDVAIKLIHDGNVRELWDEARRMDRAACQFVMRLYGMYQGCPPIGRQSMQEGIVMEFMERGSIQSLQKDLSGRPPWPLAFRLAHQVALGMNFLHGRKLLHQDLKPNNVLLNDDLNAKVADFGLSRVSTSASTSNTEKTGQVGGFYKYKPPEAFDISYQPVRAFDIYSYGILLWSIFAGKDPYPAPWVTESYVEVKIPMGDRPDCKEIEQMKVEGLKELIDLMKKCWDGDPIKRPNFGDCLKVTESVLSKHKKDIPHAVHEVLTKLDSSLGNQHFNQKEPSHYSPQIAEQPNDTVDLPRAPAQLDFVRGFERNLTVADGEQSHDTMDHPGVSVQPNPSSVPKKNLTVADKAKFISDKRADLIQTVSEVLTIAEELGEMVHPGAYSVIESKATTQDQMRVLYQRTFRSGGDVVKAAFYDALKKHHPNLVE